MIKAHSNDGKTFQITENGNQIGEIIYENLLFLEAEINTSNSKKYKVKPIGIFDSGISVTQEGNLVASLSLSWSGKIVISFQNGEEFILKLSNLFSNKYVLENKNRQLLFQLEAKFDWKKFYYNYEITTESKEEKLLNDPLLVLLALYAANYFIAAMSGANSGMMV